MAKTSRISPGVVIDANNHAVSPITMAQTVLMNDGNNLNDIIEVAYNEGYPKATINRDEIYDNAIVLFFDDTTTLHYENYKTLFVDNGFSATFCLRQDFISSTFTYDNLLEMQKNGMEICYHGHNHAFGQENMNSDLEAFDEEIKDKKINIYGCATPNAYAYPDNFKNRFLYIRTGGGNGVSNVASTSLQEGFGDVLTCFIDDLTTSDALTTLETSVETLFTGVNNKTLSLSIHLNNNNLPYLTQFCVWCAEKNLPIISAKKQFDNYVMKYGGLDKKANIHSILSGSETNNYFLVAGNGKVRTNQFTTV